MSAVLIVGASRGIGLEFVRQYRAGGTKVVATARGDDLSSEEAMCLLDGMDAGSVLRFGVRIEFEWATGAAKDVKILSVAAGD